MLTFYTCWNTSQSIIKKVNHFFASDSRPKSGISQDFRWASCNGVSASSKFLHVPSVWYQVVNEYRPTCWMDI